MWAVRRGHRRVAHDPARVGAGVCRGRQHVTDQVSQVLRILCRDFWQAGPRLRGRRLPALDRLLLLRRRQVVLADSLFDLLRTRLAAMERIPERAQKEEDDARGPDVALRANISNPALDLLGRLEAELWPRDGRRGHINHQRAGHSIIRNVEVARQEALVRLSFLVEWL